LVSPEQVAVTSAQTFGAARILQWIVDPAKFIVSLKQLALRAGIRIHVRSQVSGINEVGAGVRVDTFAGKVTAAKAMPWVSALPPSHSQACQVPPAAFLLGVLS
jgi:hypothetical protein